MRHRNTLTRSLNALRRDGPIPPKRKAVFEEQAHQRVPDFDPDMVPESRVDYLPNGAEISELSLRDETDRPVNLLRRGHRYRIRYLIAFTDRCEDVGAGTLIKTLTGVEIASASTAHLAERERTGVPGRVTEVVWEFDCNLLVGTYFVNAGCSSVVYGERRFLHRDHRRADVPGAARTGVAHDRDRRSAPDPTGARDRGNRRPGRGPVTGGLSNRQHGESSWMLRGLRKLAGRSTGDPVVPAAPGARGPGFIGIGGQKSGTTWLFSHLERHPGVSFPGGKEVHYWDWHYGVASSGTAACSTARRAAPLRATSRLHTPRSTRAWWRTSTGTSRMPG